MSIRKVVVVGARGQLGSEICELFKTGVIFVNWVEAGEMRKVV